MASYYVSGYKPPSGVGSKADVKAIQQSLGIKADGIWGPKTQAAYSNSKKGTPSSPTGAQRVPDVGMGLTGSNQQPYYGSGSGASSTNKNNPSSSLNNKGTTCAIGATGYSWFGMGITGGSPENMPGSGRSSSASIPSPLSTPRRTPFGTAPSWSGIELPVGAGNISMPYTGLDNSDKKANDIDIIAYRRSVLDSIDKSTLTPAERARARTTVKALRAKELAIVYDAIARGEMAELFSKDAIDERIEKVRNGELELGGSGVARGTSSTNTSAQKQKLADLERQRKALKDEIARIPAWETIRAFGAGGRARYNNEALEKLRRVEREIVAIVIEEAFEPFRKEHASIQEGYNHGGLDEKTITVNDPHAPNGSFTIPFLGANEELRLQTLLEDHNLLGGPNEGRDHNDIYWANFEPGIMGLAAQPGQANLHALPYYAPFPAAERAYYDSLGMLAGTVKSLALGQIAANQHESAKAKENADWERMNQQEILQSEQWYYDNWKPKWPDNYGFDGTSRKTVLQPGETIDRFGADTGTFVSMEGTPWNARSLPAGSQYHGYKQYKIIQPFEVDAGQISPWFDQPGGGIQYKLPLPVKELIRQGYIVHIP